MKPKNAPATTTVSKHPPEAARAVLQMKGGTSAWLIRPESRSATPLAVTLRLSQNEFSLSFLSADQVKKGKSVAQSTIFLVEIVRMERGADAVTAIESARASMHRSSSKKSKPVVAETQSAFALAVLYDPLDKGQTWIGFVFHSAVDVSQWSYGLGYLHRLCRPAFALNPLPVIVERSWLNADRDADGALDADEVVRYLGRDTCQIRLHKRDVQALFAAEDVQTDSSGRVVKTGFPSFLLALRFRCCPDLGMIWDKYAKGRLRIPHAAFVEFLHQEQRDLWSGPADAAKIAVAMGSDVGLDKSAFTSFLLMSSGNNCTSPVWLSEFADPGRPLSHFHIATAWDMTATKGAVTEALTDGPWRAIHFKVKPSSTTGGPIVGDEAGGRFLDFGPLCQTLRDAAFAATSWPLLLILEVPADLSGGGGGGGGGGESPARKLCSAMATTLTESLGSLLLAPDVAKNAARPAFGGVGLTASLAKGRIILIVHAPGAADDAAPLTAIASVPTVPFAGTVQSTLGQLAKAGTSTPVLLLGAQQAPRLIDLLQGSRTLGRDALVILAPPVGVRAGNHPHMAALHATGVSMVGTRRTVSDDGFYITCGLFAGNRGVGFTPKCAPLLPTAASAKKTSGLLAGVSRGGRGGRGGRGRLFTAPAKPASGAGAADADASSSQVTSAAVAAAKKAAGDGGVLSVSEGQVDSFVERWSRPGVETLMIRIICGANIAQSDDKQAGTDPPDPFIVLRCVGLRGALGLDGKPEWIDASEARSRVVWDNGFNPSFGEDVIVSVRHREAAFLLISVYEKDPGDLDELICVASVPVAALRPGFRNVTLMNPDSYGPFPDRPTLLLHISAMQAGTIAELSAEVVEVEKTIQRELAKHAAMTSTIARIGELQASFSALQTKHSATADAAQARLAEADSKFCYFRPLDSQGPLPGTDDADEEGEGAAATQAVTFSRGDETLQRLDQTGTDDYGDSASGGNCAVM
eukprot:TRINITY_DN965_c0_g1_i1.p1 TRINITY_DN965_c0_g1~~TRINITY_DN965_c0_g1_i1.p1  ORF type:complete len:978 (+),score=142.22 TRINITY_DN965_c0_g1_i1:125-3058(+)